MSERSPLRLESFESSSAEVISAWARSVEEARAWCSIADAPVPPELVISWSRELGVEAYVLRDGDGPIAYGEMWIDDDEGEVELGHLIVDSQLRNQGIGRELVRGLVTRARAHHTDVFLRVRPENTSARRCYRAAGFIRVAEIHEQAWNQGQPSAYVWMAAE